MIYGWSPGLGDPTWIGYFTVCSYVWAAFLCWKCSSMDLETHFIWKILAIAMLALGINKQLDLQSLFTQIGRHMALREGWFSSRRTVQLYFIAAMSAILFLISIFLVLVTKHRDRAMKVATSGFILLLYFVLVRAASFHHFDIFLSEIFLGSRWNSILELGGIAVVAIGALDGIRSAR